MITLIGIIVICVVIYLAIRKPSEKFTSKTEKIESILQWFDKHPSGSYMEFKEDLPEADQLDYATAIKLRTRGQLDMAHLRTYM